MDYPVHYRSVHSAVLESKHLHIIGVFKFKIHTVKLQKPRGSVQGGLHGFHYGAPKILVGCKIWEILLILKIVHY